MAITIDGSSGVSGVNGSATTPALQGTDSNTGVVFGTDTVQVATGGSTRTTVDSSGRLLVGTASASGAGRLVVSGNTVNGEDSIVTIDRGSATTSAGDTLGRINFTNGGDGVVHGAILCQTDAASGSNDNPGRLVLSTTADGASSPTERVKIQQDGLFRAFSANSVVHAYSGSAAGGTKNLYWGGHSATNVDGSGATNSFVVRTNGNVGNTNNDYGSLSDIKLKENIVDATSQWEDIKAIRIRKYNFKEETGHETFTQLGVIAQEVETVSPGLVTESPDLDVEGNDLGTVTKSVSYSVLYMKAVKALQEAQTRIEALETKVAALEAA